MTIEKIKNNIDSKKGNNVKLASRLTKYKISVKTLSQINEEGNSN